MAGPRSTHMWHSPTCFLQGILSRDAQMVYGMLVLVCLKVPICTANLHGTMTMHDSTVTHSYSSQLTPSLPHKQTYAKLTLYVSYTTACTLSIVHYCLREFFHLGNDFCWHLPSIQGCHGQWLYDKQTCLHAFSTSFWYVSSLTSKLMMKKVQRRAARNTSRRLRMKLTSFTTNKSRPIPERLMV